MLSLAFCSYPLIMMNPNNKSRKKYCRYKQILQARRLFSNKCSQVNNLDLRMKYLKSLGLCSIKLQRGYSSRMNRGLRSSCSFNRTKLTPCLPLKSISRPAWQSSRTLLPQTASPRASAFCKTSLIYWRFLVQSSSQMTTVSSKLCDNRDRSGILNTWRSCSPSLGCLSATSARTKYPLNSSMRLWNFHNSKKQISSI